MLLKSCSEKIFIRESYPRRSVRRVRYANSHSARARLQKIIEVDILHCTATRGLGNHPTFSTRRYKTHLKNRHEIGGQSECDG